MVQGVLTNIIAYQDRPFEHLFVTDTDADRERIYEAVAPDYEMTMTGSAASFTLIEGAGLTVAVNGKNKALIVASIHEMDRVPTDEYVFSITARDNDGVEILNEHGVLSVLPLAPESEPVVDRPVKPWDLFNPSVPRASKEVSDARLAICHDCPQLLAGFCKECGCRMKWKTTLFDAVCPLGKWGKPE
jgi:hypothetical protein